ncbi:hypothetical protein [Actinomadura chokoriensis]|uniref:Acyl carrier protein n=1 Tax=Actinomadura chokoriensis TaxID=454156 RepID=A0ABV4R4V5_9ACTN
MIDYENVLAGLTGFIEERVLGSSDGELDATTPLLEWGILTSMNMARMVTFILDEFHLYIPPDRIVGANFKNLDTITRLVLSLRDDPVAQA